MRLSSDYLYHFKKDFNSFKSILEEGFQYRKWIEQIPYKQMKQENYIVCFCDIKFGESQDHRECYGSNAIILTKEWGIRNGVSPVRYVHENSPEVSYDYQKMKLHFRDVRDNAKLIAENIDDERIRKRVVIDAIIEDLSVFSILDDLGLLSNKSIQNNIDDDPELLNQYDLHKKKIEKIFEILKNENAHWDLKSLLNSLSERINMLHNELEKRDALQRIYRGDFQHPNSDEVIRNKVFYDEREWRSVKLRKTYDSPDCLPETENLKFTDNDVKAILVEDKVKMDMLKDYFFSSQTLLTPRDAIEKIHLTSEYLGD